MSFLKTDTKNYGADPKLAEYDASRLILALELGQDDFSRADVIRVLNNLLKKVTEE